MNCKDPADTDAQDRAPPPERFTSYARSALWIAPFVAIVLVLAVAPALLNDSTTAVLALDQIHRLLKVVGKPEDLALARVPDTQGLGGSSAARFAGRT